MNATCDHIHRDFQSGVLALTLDRPKVNALNLALVAALQSELKRAASDSQVRVVLLSGAGGNFSAGQDVVEMLQASGTSYRRHLLQTYNPLILQLRRIEKPVLASIDGGVAGAALGIILACDLRLASERAHFSVGFARIGLVPDSAVSLLLPATVGLGRATELCLLNSTLSAAQALDFGLVNRVVPVNELNQLALELAHQLANGPTHTYGLTKRAFNQAVLPDLEMTLNYEAYLQDIAGQSTEHAEGVRAFIEKRPPRFAPDPNLVPAEEK